MSKTLPVPRNLGLHDRVGDELNKLEIFISEQDTSINVHKK